MIISNIKPGMLIEYNDIGKFHKDPDIEEHFIAVVTNAEKYSNAIGINMKIINIIKQGIKFDRCYTYDGLCDAYMFLDISSDRLNYIKVY